MYKIAEFAVKAIVGFGVTYIAIYIADTLGVLPEIKE